MLQSGTTRIWTSTVMLCLFSYHALELVQGPKDVFHLFNQLVGAGNLQPQNVFDLQDQRHRDKLTTPSIQAHSSCATEGFSSGLLIRQQLMSQAPSAAGTINCNTCHKLRLSEGDTAEKQLKTKQPKRTLKWLVH